MTTGDDGDEEDVVRSYLQSVCSGSTGARTGLDSTRLTGLQASLSQLETRLGPPTSGRLLVALAISTPTSGAVGPVAASTSEAPPVPCSRDPEARDCLAAASLWPKSRVNPGSEGKVESSAEPCLEGTAGLQAQLDGPHGRAGQGRASGSQLRSEDQEDLKQSQRDPRGGEGGRQGYEGAAVGDLETRQRRRRAGVRASQQGLVARSSRSHCLPVSHHTHQGKSHRSHAVVCSRYAHGGLDPSIPTHANNGTYASSDNERRFAECSQHDAHSIGQATSQYNHLFRMHVDQDALPDASVVARYDVHHRDTPTHQPFSVSRQSILDTSPASQVRPQPAGCELALHQESVPRERTAVAGLLQSGACLPFVWDEDARARIFPCHSDAGHYYCSIIIVLFLCSGTKGDLIEAT
ncbi:hypothetical protein PaG_04777 [Moesziomyces aphidis]|uniref:Uncharacterized protein n=1 Tax=Moesziomyces aphidis TaxID=84754 RepID=W3VH64_MOEAP|nr:hypothetical protein PaG_04777 [Moesziomyces aphidis]